MKPSSYELEQTSPGSNAAEDLVRQNGDKESLSKTPSDAFPDGGYGWVVVLLLFLQSGKCFKKSKKLIDLIISQRQAATWG